MDGGDSVDNVDDRLADLDGDHERFGLPDFDLARLAANLRGVMPRVDEEARDRLEHAWVAILNAIKQPKVDAVKLAARLSRLAEELDALRSRAALDGGPSDAAEDPPEANAP